MWTPKESSLFLWFGNYHAIVRLAQPFLLPEFGRLTWCSRDWAPGCGAKRVPQPGASPCSLVPHQKLTSGGGGGEVGVRSKPGGALGLLLAQCSAMGPVQVPFLLSVSLAWKFNENASQRICQKHSVPLHYPLQ